MNKDFRVLRSTIRPLTEDESSRYGHAGTHRLDVQFRLNGDTDLEFAEVFHQGQEADMITRALHIVARAIREHGGKS